METEPQTLTAHFLLHSPQVSKHSRIPVQPLSSIFQTFKGRKNKGQRGEMLSIEAIEKQEIKEGQSVYLKGK